MMSRHFRLSSKHSAAIAKRLPHAKDQLSVPGSFFNQFVTYIYLKPALCEVFCCVISGLSHFGWGSHTSWGLDINRKNH